MSHRVYLEKKETKETAKSIGDFLRSVLGGIVGVYMVLILGVLPFYHSDGYTRIGTDKATFFSWVATNLGKAAVLVLLCLAAVSVVGYFREGRKQKRKLQFSVTDVFALLYGISLLISYLASDYKRNALWGAAGWYMGLYTQLLLLGSYFFISRFWSRRKWILYVAFAASGIVFLLGYLNRFGIYPIDMKYILPGYLSTVGNINWYCGYLVIILFGGIGLLWQGTERGKGIFLMVYVTIGFATLVTQGSSSGILAMGVVLLTIFCLSAPKAPLMENFWKIMLLLGIACAGTLAIRIAFPEQITYVEMVTDFFTYSALPIIVTVVSALCYILCFWSRKKDRYPQKAVVLMGRAAWIGLLCGAAVFAVMIFINTMWPGSLGRLSELRIFTFDKYWGSSRGATWKAAAMCFAEQDFLHKLIGVGPDCMSAFLYQDGSEALQATVKERFAGATLTNAHNEWLTILVNTGLLGAASYIGMVVSGIVRYLKKRNGSRIVVMAGLCLLAYTVNNLFSFQQAMNTSTMFVLWGMGEAYMASRVQTEKTPFPSTGTGS